MQKYMKVAACFFTALCILLSVSLSVSAAVVTQDVTAEQMAIIMDVGNFNYISGYYVGYQTSNNFVYDTVTTDNDVTLFARTAVSGQTIGSSADQRNLLDPSIFVFPDGTTSTVIRVSYQLSPNTTYTISTDLPSTVSGSGTRTGYLFVALPGQAFSNSTNLVRNGVTRTFTTGQDGIIDIGYRNMTTEEIVFSDYWVQINAGSTAQAYMPYKANIGFNIPFYLSGFDSITIQFAIGGSFMNILDFDSVYSIVDSVGTRTSAEYLGTLTSTGFTTYPWHLYQVTFEDDVDICQFRFLPQSVVSDSSFTLAFGLTAVSVVADDSVIQGISGQILQINNKIDDLLTAIDGLSDALAQVVIDNSTIVSSVTEIESITSSIEQNQEIIMYSSQADQLTINQLNTRQTSVLNQLNQYNQVFDRYDNKPEVNDVLNIADDALPEGYDPDVVMSPISSVFENSLILQMMVIVASFALIGYIFYGKKG